MADRAEVRVVDHGPGVPDEAEDRISELFQRYGDAARGAGAGLAVARCSAGSMGGTPDAGDTPGGGLTMVLSLRAAGPCPEPLPARADIAEPERQNLC
ncbi:ATP-binding protein [Streptomyces sp. NPDC006314]|uniref:ATP-binding protein n=1 Tax=Streptomyces sp. NPDC006314 TaxID=3154475 RepID=UPI0033AEA2C4